jgi:hypothetical protein
MDWSYVAGYFDGEGSVRFHPHGPRKYIDTGLVWVNTHRDSLIAIQQFMKAGTFHSRCTRARCKDIHMLTVARCDDVVRVGEAMLPHLIIKRDRVAEMIAFVREHRRPYAFGMKKLAEVGVDALRQMVDDGLSRRAIGKRLGVDRTTVKLFMRRHKIRNLRLGGPGFLTAPEVLAIRAAHAMTPRPTLNALAAKYGVTFQMIHLIVTRKTWTHV